MAVAVKPENAAEPVPQSSPLDKLGVASLVGLAYVLGALGVVFYAIPYLWAMLFAGRPLINPFVTGALQAGTMLAAAAGLAWLGARLVHFKPAHGLKAGIFVAAVLLATVLLAAWCAGALVERFIPAMQAPGIALMVLVGVGLAFLGLRWFLRPGTEDFLIRLEDQGWFSATSYKKSQGLRVRRGTLLGVLILAACGVWSLVSHHTLAYGIEEGANVWFVRLPFTDGLGLYLLQDVRFTVPLLLVAAALWFGWRLVNWPAFADFLIATEAEMNKVSWTTRKRLVQDTIVVLVTVVLFTVFLFVVDVTWGFLLAKVGVLKTPDDLPQQTQELQPW